MWAWSGNSADHSNTDTSLLEKGGEEIPQTLKMKAVLWPALRVLDSLFL
jgi:hypothetical protein